MRQRILSVSNSPLQSLMLNGGLCELIVGAQVTVQVVVERVRGVRAEVRRQSPDGQVHLTQPPGGRVGLLPKDGDIVALSAVRFDELSPTGRISHPNPARVIDAPTIRLQNLDQQADNRGRRVELSTLLAFSAGKLAQEVLVRRAPGCPGLALTITKANRTVQVTSSPRRRLSSVARP